MTERKNALSYEWSLVRLFAVSCTCVAVGCKFEGVPFCIIGAK
jgi:hypothetical protein